MSGKKYSITYLIAALIVGLCFSVNTFAAALDIHQSGVYAIDSTLSCYVNAMGGIEFGEPLLVDSVVAIDSNGIAKLTIHLSKSSVSIYSVTCDTFIDPNPNSSIERGGVKNGTIGYYDSAGVLQTQNVDITVSSDTALNPENKEVHYVSSITFPIDQKKDTYHLSMYINSNVMGVQFSEPGDDATESAYAAVLAVDWDSLTTGENPSTAVVEEISEKAAAPIVDEGLNIYYPELETPIVETPEVAVSSTYLVLTNNHILLVTAVVGLVMFLIGISLLVMAKLRQKKS